MTESMSQRCNCCSSSSYSTAFHRKKREFRLLDIKMLLKHFGCIRHKQQASKQKLQSKPMQVDYS